jgi:hypothetical protein
LQQQPPPKRRRESSKKEKKPTDLLVKLNNKRDNIEWRISSNGTKKVRENTMMPRTRKRSTRRFFQPSTKKITKQFGMRPNGI